MADKYDRTERLNFLALDDATCNTPREFREVLAPELPGILDAFYGYVTKWPDLAGKFPSESALKRARGQQERHWLDNLFSANFGEAYMSQIDSIGRAHVRVDLEPRWYMGGYCFTLNALIKLATETYAEDPHKLADVITAINKAVFLDMDMAISVYLDVSKENAASTLNTHAGNFEETVKGMVEIVAAAATELQSTAQTMEGTASHTTEQAGSVASAAEEASGNVQTVAAAAEELSSAIAEISRQVSQSTDIAGKAVSEAHRTNEMVQGLDDAAQKIGEVVSLINDIASKTNLLALNATIEAARAGEAGKGFAVVASEVKSLANQTAKATDQIKEQIGDIQSATQHAVGAIGGIGATIGEINEIASAIAAAVEEQGAATQEIARSVEEAASGTSQVTSSIGAVTEAATETGQAAGQVLEAAGELSGQAEMLTIEVSKFLETIRSDAGVEHQEAPPLAVAAE